VLHEPPKDLKAPRPPEKKPKRFRLVKLEERIAPAQGGVTSPGHGCFTSPCHTFTCGL
jgi:hypothetical protein